MPAPPVALSPHCLQGDSCEARTTDSSTHVASVRVSDHRLGSAATFSLTFIPRPVPCSSVGPGSTLFALQVPPEVTPPGESETGLPRISEVLLPMTGGQPSVWQSLPGVWYWQDQLASGKLRRGEPHSTPTRAGLRLHSRQPVLLGRSLHPAGMTPDQDSRVKCRDGKRSIRVTINTAAWNPSRHYLKWTASPGCAPTVVSVSFCRRPCDGDTGLCGVSSPACDDLHRWPLREGRAAWLAEPPEDRLSGRSLTERVWGARGCCSRRPAAAGSFPRLKVKDSPEKDKIGTTRQQNMPPICITWVSFTF